MTQTGSFANKIPDIATRRKYKIPEISRYKIQPEKLAS